MSQIPRPVGNTLIPKSTPLHIADLTFLLIQETLRNPSDSDYPFKITDDFNTSTVMLDTVFNKDSGVFGKKPLIIVSRGPQSSSPIAVGDRAALQTRTWNKKESTVMRSSVEVRVISREPKEVDILSQHVFNMLMFMRVTLPGILGILMVEGVNMSQVAPLEHEDHLYECSASMPYQMQYIWRHEIPQQLLLSLKVLYNDMDSFISEKNP